MSKNEEMDESFERYAADVDDLKEDLIDDEQKLVDAWLDRLRNVQNDKEREVRLDYIFELKNQLTKEPKVLADPFTRFPPNSPLPPLHEPDSSGTPANAGESKGGKSPSKDDSPSSPKQQPDGQAEADEAEGAASKKKDWKERSRYFCSAKAQERKPPCKPQSRKPMPQPAMKTVKNEFEDPQEMAKRIARSKGMMLAEFVADISRHTSDKGNELRKAMKAEMTSFSEYVERILTQRIKDMGELMDENQTHELLKIQNDCSMWQQELMNCKKKLKEIIPNFDIEAYRKGRNYFKREYHTDASTIYADDNIKEWKEENCHRLKWFVNEIEKLTAENNKVSEETSRIKSKIMELEKQKSEKQKCYTEKIEAEEKKYKMLKQKSDKLSREIADLLVLLGN